MPARSTHRDPLALPHRVHHSDVKVGVGWHLGTGTRAHLDLRYLGQLLLWLSA